VQNVQPVHLGLATGAGTAERGVHGRVDPVLEGPRAGLLGLPQVRSDRRAANVRLFAADLLATGEAREDLTDGRVADIVRSLNAAEYWVLLVRERSWTPQGFADWLIDARTRFLLARP